MAAKRGKTRTSSHIRWLQKDVISRISEWGFDVWVSYARKTKSRYLEFFVARHKIRIRLSDHVSYTIREFDYDIWVDKPRLGACSYKEWVKDMEGKIAAIREQENAVKNSSWESL
jgi:hypothetical protein